MKNCRLYLIISLFLTSFHSVAQKTIEFTHTQTSPVIDGKLDDDIWSKCPTNGDFTQFEPNWNVAPSQKTEVKICYTNDGIYVGAMLYDNAPDSILQEIGMRDNSVNADHFAIEFDPYNTMQDAYYFQVTASGVQSEVRRTDGYYNAVWESSVKILDNGWSVELFIPFSAFTFPNKTEQEWRVQFYRNLRRHRELSTFMLEDKTNDNDIQYWSISSNLRDIKPPLRLFLNPYMNGVVQKDASESEWSSKINGGLDLKWGVNQSYTLDMTLLPDFSQVKSDNKVKNLSAFETIYGDYRPFFYESMSLFQKGSLIYSRRIGGRPMHYNNPYNQLDTNEKVAENPQTSQLINAVKFYGRSANGLAVGFFNAITNKTLAYIENSQGERRSVETQPLTNYNIFVLDKALKGKSNIFFSNANTYRGTTNINANVSALGGNYYFYKGTYKVYLLGGMSRRADSAQFYSNKALSGYKSEFTFAKVNGKLQFEASAWLEDNHYDPNDMGLNFYNDEISTYYYLSYREPNPFWKVLSMRNTLTLNYATKWSTGMPTTYNFSYAFSTTTKKYLSLWGGLSCRPDHSYDYYEPRNGQFYKTPRYLSGNANFSTDYRKTFALDGAYQITTMYDTKGLNHYFYLSPLARIGNHINLRYTVWYANNDGERGFAYIQNDESIFGKRHLQTVENSLTSKYVFVNSLSFALTARYYWVKGDYSEFYTLKQDGFLGDALSNQTVNRDFTYSAFNIDCSFNWDFAPGSSLVLTYKNELVYELENADKSYMQYLRYSFNNPFSNLIALKLVYFIDAGRAVRRVKSSSSL